MKTHTQTTFPSVLFLDLLRSGVSIECDRPHQKMSHTTKLNSEKLMLTSAHSVCSDCQEPRISLVPKRIRNETKLISRGVSEHEITHKGTMREI